MTTHEHILTVVEPTTGGDATLALAHETVERGGTASVVMVITDRVRRDIRDFARSEDLDRAEAEATALDRLRAHCHDRVGGSPSVVTHYGDLTTSVSDHLTDGTTAIALPERLAAARWVRRLAATTGLPVTIAPARAA